MLSIKQRTKRFRLKYKPRGEGVTSSAKLAGDGAEINGCDTAQRHACTPICKKRPAQADSATNRGKSWPHITDELLWAARGKGRVVEQLDRNGRAHNLLDLGSSLTCAPVSDAQNAQVRTILQLHEPLPIPERSRKAFEPAEKRATLERLCACKVPISDVSDKTRQWHTRVEVLPREFRTTSIEIEMRSRKAFELLGGRTMMIDHHE